ncbi:MAG TPA: cytidylate kinase family protein [Candidatus Nanoarchaeia archaeon]|nr:cytidylate kinase family protein [Candidatus Nanoarchaeia archaeon]
MIITLGGRAGAGKSSVGRSLADALDYKFYSAGDVRREYAVKHGLTLAELNERAKLDPASDFLVDDYMKAMAEHEGDFVIDAWLGFHFFPNSVKFFLNANPELRASRIFNRNHSEELSSGLEEALGLMTEKENCSAARYKNLYGVDIYDLKNYDLIVDTTNKTVGATTLILYDFIMQKKEGYLLS